MHVRKHQVISLFFTESA